MRANSILSTLFGLAFFAAVAYGIYHLLRLGGGLFDGVGREVTVVTLVAAAALMAASLVGNGLHAIGRRTELREQRAARAAVYAQVLRLRGQAFDGFGAAEADAADGSPEPRLLLHASAEVLNAYLRLRRAEAESGTGGAAEEMARLVRAMRRDLGHRGADVAVPDLGELLRPAPRHGARV